MVRQAASSPQNAAFQHALAALRTGRVIDAENLLNETLRADPRNVAALNLFAVLLMQLGRFAEAEAYLRRALQEQPKSETTLYNYGITLKALNRPAEALERFSRAMAINAVVAETWNNRGTVFNDLKRYNEAIADFDKAIELNPQYAEARYNKAKSYAALGRFGNALSECQRALELKPDLAEAWCGCGNAYWHLKRYVESSSSFDTALGLKPNFTEAWVGRGNALAKREHHDQALAAYDKALALKPDVPEAYLGRGNVFTTLKRYKEAFAAYDKALGLEPDLAEAQLGRGNVLTAFKRHDEALAAYDKALALNPDLTGAWLGRGNICIEIKRHDEALAAYHKALALEPTLADAYNSIGNVLRELGHLQEAQDAYLKALQLDPDDAGIYVNLANCKRFTQRDDHLSAMETLAAKSDLSQAKRMQLDFALGKAYGDLNDYSRSFTHLLAGNAAKRATITYDEASAFTLFDQIEMVFTRSLIAQKSGGGDPSRLPIFIIGMPRSGTTLIEQIIASHPMVYGAGELETFSKLFLTVRGPEGNTLNYPEFVPVLDHSAVRQIGTRYIDEVRKLAPFGERVTDKMPSNYYFVGLIHLALPGAKIIHSIRNPVDTCISCFSKLFSAEQNHTYDLAELGRYYTRYEQLMAHWHCVLPAQSILDVHYEEVVADVEGQARRIIAYCDLPWDDRCLKFHEIYRPVRTASATQVRQPIYKTAVGRWRAYEKHLGPLLKTLSTARAET
jgi:tetratricopeptide (TPR) repeat protein